MVTGRLGSAPAPTRKQLNTVSLLLVARAEMFGLLQVLAGIAVVFFLPGYTLVCALFPRKGELDPEYDIVYRVALGMGLSIVIAILIGFSLNALSTEEQGLVTAGPLWLAFAAVTGAFFAIGWLRGAYPFMGWLHPSLYRPPPSRTIGGIRFSSTRNERRMSSLALERERLLSELDKCSERAESSAPSRKGYYDARRDDVRRCIEEVNAELERLREEARIDGTG